MTGDYSVDPATLQQKQMPPLRQRVLLALRTVVASSNAVPGMGVVLPRKAGTQYAAQVRAAVSLAVRQMTDVEKVMRLDSVDVRRLGTGRSLITVSYTDLTTLESEEVSTNG